MRFSEKLDSFWCSAAEISRTEGKGILRQLSEIARHKFRNPTLGITDYYTYRLHRLDPGNRSLSQSYLGWRVQEELAYAVNVRAAVLPGWDKFTFHLYADRFGIPAPRVLASFRPCLVPQEQASGTLLTHSDQLEDWLRANKQWPIFAKPCFSQQSVGCFHISSYHAADDTLEFLGDKPMRVEDFVRQVILAPSGPYFKREMGYLFQAVMHPHDDIVALTGNSTISGIRVIVAQDETGPELVSAFWRIARHARVSDLWIDRESGHLAAPVDVESGIVGAAINGLAPQEFTHSPETGVPIQGFQLPDWSVAKALCLASATIFPLVRLQHWDVALTDQGPRLLEFNDVGAFGFPQMFGQGLLTPKLRKILIEKGDKRRYPWIESLCSQS